jgi:NAD+--dinitrogen-reductase ADP-D-ribosyltransferase
VSQHVSTRCNQPPWVLASLDFQADPAPLEIVGVRSSEERLFRLLDHFQNEDARGLTFHEYLSARFQLEEWDRKKAGAREVLRHSYLRYLLGWGNDSNGQSGAVLKSWVESRFGLRPTYHGGKLPYDPTAVEKYHHDRIKGQAETTSVEAQLDLLYTFCQYEFGRRKPDDRWLVLYRGTHDPDEYAVVHEPGGGDSVELNNLSSFTSDPEIAWEFGSLVWKVRIPVAKVTFFSGLLSRHLLEGEKEYLVMGGRYRVEKLRW